MSADARSYQPHVVPVRKLLIVFASLITLTGLTVFVADLPLGEWDAAVAIGIATVKATLVAAIFMHLKYDSRFHGLLLVFATLFVVLFLALTLLDENSEAAQTGEAEVVSSKSPHKLVTSQVTSDLRTLLGARMTTG